MKMNEKKWEIDEVYLNYIEKASRKMFLFHLIMADKKDRKKTYDRLRHELLDTVVNIIDGISFEEVIEKIDKKDK